MLIREVKVEELLDELRGKYGETSSFKYCEEVFLGEARASIKTKQGCKRFLRDLKLSEEGESNYYFDVKEANSLEGMGRLLVDPTTRKPFTPALFQLYILQQLAWYRKVDKARRYRKMYISLGRKQGKSLIVAFMIVYEFLFGKVPEYEREIVLTSRSEDQAKKIFTQIKTILSVLVSNTESLKGRLKLGTQVIYDEKSGSTITYYSSNPDNIDSTNPVMGVVDEYAEAKNGKEMYERIQSGMTYQKNGLMIAVSTVSGNLNSPMFEDYKYVEKVLNDDIDSDREFIYIAELDSDEEWRDKDNWSKSAPLLLEEGFREHAMDTIMEDIKKAEEKGDMTTLMTKTFNRWGKSNENRYLNYNQWEDSVKEEDVDIRGKKVHVGLDLSERNDLTSLGFVIEAGDHLYVDGHSFVANTGYTKGKTMAEKRLNAEQEIKKKGNRDEFDYLKAEELGHVTISKGTIDYKEVIGYIEKYVEENELELVGVYYDPWGMTKFITDMRVMGVEFPLVEVGQRMSILSEPIKEFRVNLVDGYIKHSDNSVLNYSVKNAVVKESNGELMLDKPSANLKIDALASVINAYSELIGYMFDVGESYNGLSDLDKILQEGGFFG